MRCTIACVVVASGLAWTVPARAEDATLVAHYAFDEGAGSVLHDRSGHGHDGTIVGATWQHEGGRPALRFRGKGDYVDFGDDRVLKMTGDMSILVWARLDASPYPDDGTNWTIIDCEQFNKEGFLLRIDGAARKAVFRGDHDGGNDSMFGAALIDNHAYFQLAVVRKGDSLTMYVNGMPDAQFTVRCIGPGASPFRISNGGQSFNGLIDDVQIFSGALGLNDVVAHYRAGAGARGKDTSQFGKLGLQGFVYETEGQAVTRVNFLGALPLAADERVTVELGRPGGEAVQSHRVDGAPVRCQADYSFDLSALEPGDYELRAMVVAGSQVRTRTAVPFTHPAPPVQVAAPAERTVPALPARPAAPACAATLAPGGGLVLTAGTHAWHVESFFSVPGGGENALRIEGGGGGGEKTWRVASEPRKVEAAGRFYRVSREVEEHPDHVVVKDTLSNLGDEPLGVMFRHSLGSRESFSEGVLGGNAVTSPSQDRDLRYCPVAFVAAKDMGAGLVALDDVFIVQCRGGFGPDAVSIGSREFALAGRGSYTLEWAVYFTGTTDHYDLVNAVRRDEGRNGVTVEGGWAPVPGSQSRRDASLAPPATFYQMRNLKYVSINCLSWATDDPTVSLEGIEFVEYPREQQAVCDLLDAIHRTVPDAYGMFHVAQSLYATGSPETLWPDSRLIQADGTQAVYPNDYGNGGYFSKDRGASNWRWWIYYPTLTNAYGRALLESVDVMMDRMHARGVFVDGFLWGYGGEYTYDRFDGHSADIDPATGLITRTKASVLLLSQDAMIAYSRKVHDKGGVVIANNTIVTRTLGRERLIHDKEITEGPYVHLAPTPVALGNPSAIKSEQDVYADVLAKLRWGNLYFFYGEPPVLTYPSVPVQMYPITVQEIHSGCVKGLERIVTMNGGVYGWAGDRDLHLVHHYDARGHLAARSALTTVDGDSVRTQLQLGEDESAVIRRIPLTLSAARAINACVERYDTEAVRIAINGTGRTRLTLRSGDFPIQPGAAYSAGVADGRGVLSFDVDLDGPTTVTITSK